MVDEIGYDSAYTFVYSPCNGTEAAAMEDQVPHEVKIERMERLVELTQRIARDRNEARVGRVEQVLVEGPSGPIRRPARPHATQHDRRLPGDAAAGELVDVRMDGASSTTLRGDRPRSSRPEPFRHTYRSGYGMRMLITGSSGQIGTNLALRCCATATTCSASTSARTRGRTRSRRSCRTSPATTRRSPVASTASSTRRSTSSSTSRRTRRCTSSSAAAPRARERDHDVQRARVRRGLELPLVFSSTREVYGDVHRFEEYARKPPTSVHGEPVLGVEDRERGVHLLVRALLRARLPRLPLLERLRPLRQRPVAHGTRAAAVHPQLARGEPITIFGGEEKVLDFTYVDDCVDGITRGVDALARRAASRTRRSTSPTARATRSCARPS